MTNATVTRVVLASASPRRLELLRSLGLEVEVAPSAYHEPPLVGLPPDRLAVVHAREKLRSSFDSAPSGRSARPSPFDCASLRDAPLRMTKENRTSARPSTTVLRTSAQADIAVPVVAADTVVDVDGLALGKPADAEDAARMLRLLSGREHRVHTAFALRLPGVAAPVEELSTTRVRFYALDDEEIAQYVAGGEPMDKAGGYGIQGRAAALVESIAGDFYTVMGFPLGRFVRTLRRSGFSIAAANPGLP